MLTETLNGKNMNIAFSYPKFSSMIFCVDDLAVFNYYSLS